MIHIHYTKNAKALADVEIEAKAKWLADMQIGFPSHTTTYWCNNELLILACRVLIKKGIIPNDQLKIEVNGKNYPVDSDGRFSIYPPELETSNKLLHELL